MVKNGKNVKNGNKMYPKAKRKNDAILGSAKAGFYEFLIVSIFKVLTVFGFLSAEKEKGKIKHCKTSSSEVKPTERNSKSQKES